MGKFIIFSFNQAVDDIMDRLPGTDGNGLTAKDISRLSDFNCSQMQDFTNNEFSWSASFAIARMCTGDGIDEFALDYIFDTTDSMRRMRIFAKRLKELCKLCDTDDPPSPLVLDLDGDGVEAGGAMFFDHAGDGFAELGAWASVDDGVLVIDLNGNGKIDSGAELFGNNTMVGERKAEHGFAALRQLDSNADGVVDSADSAWSRLRVYRWRDSDSDGLLDEGEGRLETLAANNIASLGLSHVTSTAVDAIGNEHRQVGSFTKSDGTTHDLVDVWFRTAPNVTRYDRAAVPEHSETVAGLPDAAGAGLVYDLGDAMSLDDAGRLVPPLYGPGRQEQRTLSQLVTAFKAATTESARDALVEKILHRWAGAEGVSIGDYWRGSYFSFTTPQKLAVVEAFGGGKWREGDAYRHPALSTSLKINRIYRSHFENLRAELLAQTTLKDLFEAVSIMHDGEEVTSETDLGDVSLGDLTLDFSGVLDLEDAATLKGDFLRSLAALSQSDPEVYSALESASAKWAYEYRYHSEHLIGMVSDGLAHRVHEIADGNTLNTFRTTDGGNHILRGGRGTDVYQLGRGTGHDVIEEDFRGNNGGSPAVDIVSVAPGIALSGVVMGRDAHDLIISLVDAEGQATDSLRVKDHYVNANARIERVEFGDGTVYTTEDLAALPLSEGDGTQGPDHFDASLMPGALGGSQRGGKGADTYLLGRGTGHESVDELHRNHAGSAGDAIRLKAGLVLADVRLSRHGADLKVGLVGSDGALTDSLTIKGQYLGGARKVEFLESSDGTRLLDLGVAGPGVKLQNGDAGGVIEGLGGGIADTFGIDAGSDTFRGKSGDDVYELGLGSGTDYVEEGHQNRLSGGADTIRLGAGVTSSMVRMRRTMWDLVVELVGSAGEVTDSLTVRDQYRLDWAKVERVVLQDGSVLWSASDIEGLPFTGPTYRQSSETIRGTSSADSLEGSAGVDDVFDSDAGGDDALYGYAGNDEYRLGTGTGSDSIHEGYGRWGQGGDAGDLVRVESGHGTGDVRLRRDGNHLFVELLGAAGEDGIRSVTDSLKVCDHFSQASAKIETVEFADGTVWDADEFHAVALRGTAGNEYIEGRADLAEVFDSDAGGDDALYGYAGDDEYRLGTGTGSDTIHEGYNRWGQEGDAGDLVRVESGHGTGDVRLRRDGNHLFVELLGAAGEDGTRAVTDSLKVCDYFDQASAKIETVEFADGTVWDADDFHAVVLCGTAGNEDIEGRSDMDDIFDSDAGGDDALYGYAGDDEYRLGTGTGSDTIHEGYNRWNQEGDAGDLVRVETGHGTGDVRLRRDDRHLWVELLGAAGEDGIRAVTDSLKVCDYFDQASAKIETVEFADGTVWDADDFHAVALRGAAGNEDIEGRSDLDDIFDSDGGGDDALYGYAGDDEYRLGAGTGSDTIHEGYNRWGQAGDAGDLVRIESGHGTGDVRLRRDGNHLLVELLGVAGEDGVRPVTDSLKVSDHFSQASAKIETVEFADGTEWDGDFVVGTTQGDTVTSTTASETLHGGHGDDIYVVSGEFGDDRVVDSGGTDKVRVSGHASSTLSFLRDGEDMVMGVVGSHDRVTFDNWYADGDSRKVERIETGDKVLLSTAAERMATAMATFVSGGGTASDFVSRNHQDYWETLSGTPGG